jgi:DNA segregation ATPase FtsK/SpoIIIE-like protein
LFLALAAYLAVALTGPLVPWWQALLGGETPELLPADNPGGPVGALLSLALRVLLGSAWCWAIPLILGSEGLALLARRRGAARLLLQRAVPAWLATTSWIAQPHGPLPAEIGAAWGGIAGIWLGRGFHFLFGLWGGRIFLTFFLLLSLGLITRPWLAPLWRHRPSLVNPLRAVASGLRDMGDRTLRVPVVLIRALRGFWANMRAPRRVAIMRPREEQPAAKSTGGQAAAGVAAVGRRLHLAVEESGVTDASPALASGTAGPMATRTATARAEEGSSADPVRSARPPSTRAEVERPVYVLPGRDLLRAVDADGNGLTPAELDAAADLLESTLRSFGVEGEVKDVRPGPVVTTFEYQPAPGVKVSQITQRANDLALAMKARSIRMEAPIPGKAAVGIEIPNPHPEVVRLQEVLALAEDRFRRPLCVALGKNVTGQPVVIDIARLPHLLVAGSTGSGKSVCLNAIICNLLLHNDPSRVRFVLIDPKMLEMSVYNGLPHLLLPVVTDPREALKALKWMVAQMDARYTRLAHARVRDIESYNERVARGEVKGPDNQPVSEPMPYYLTIVDELADLMLQLGQEFELPITRLAGKARAVGIHLILATQRPSVDVITGVIKANIPCRIAFRVIQRNDSRTILDMNGAEALLGRGDMLYLQPGRALPVRVQGALIEIDECQAIVQHWQQFAGATEEIFLDEEGSGVGDYSGEDDLFEAARRIVVLHQSGSTSLLQRRLRIGYTRAGRLIDMLEEAGVVGPFTGSKAREVLLKPEDLSELGMDEGEA